MVERVRGLSKFNFYCCFKTLLCFIKNITKVEVTGEVTRKTQTSQKKLFHNLIAQIFYNVFYGMKIN